MNRLIVDLATNLLCAPDLGKAREAVRRAAAGLGVERYAYGRRSNNGTLMIDSTYPPAWQERYMKHSYFDFDPVVIEAARSSLPFAWRYVANRDTLTAQQRQLFAEAAEHGLRDGFTVPLHDGRGMALMSFAFGDTAQMKNIVGGQSNLRLLAIYYNAAVERLLDEGHQGSGGADLSAMEQLCLTHAAAGRSLWEISATLHRAETDVAASLRSAREKMGVATTAQAVAKAMASGLISP